MTLGMLARLTHLEGRVTSVEKHLEQAWEALSDLGCQSCEMCGQWWQPTTNPTRGGKLLEEPEIWVCDVCLPHWWQEMRASEPEYLPAMTYRLLTWLLTSGQVDRDTRGSTAPFATLQGATYPLSTLITRLQKTAMAWGVPTLSDALAGIAADLDYGPED